MAQKLFYYLICYPVVFGNQCMYFLCFRGDRIQWNFLRQTAASGWGLSDVSVTNSVPIFQGVLVIW